jgi:Tol biopolymer transport system component
MNSFRSREALTLTILTLVGAAASVRPDAPGHKESAGRIVYEHAPDGRAPWPIIDIYSVDTDGASVKALTNDGHSHTPSWSPDGRRILFVHDASLRTKPPYREGTEFESHHPVELYAMDRDGSSPHLLRRLEEAIFSAAWSPDGKTLAVTYLPKEWRKLPSTLGEPIAPGLFLFSADGQGEPRLLFRDAFTPAWSPDGKKLAFSARLPGSRWAVHVANADGSKEVQLTDPSLDAGSPAWSPDGKQIAFEAFLDGHRRRQIFVMDENGSGSRQLTTDANWACEHPSWSPDGKQITFFCRLASAPCAAGVGSSQLFPSGCVRRISLISPHNPQPKPTQLTEHDGAFPAFAPVH